MHFDINFGYINALHVSPCEPLQIVNEEIEFDIILTTYNMVISSADDRVLFRKLDFHYVIFDEAHMLKNMATSRYENLMRVRASRYNSQL